MSGGARLNKVGVCTASAIALLSHPMVGGDYLDRVIDKEVKKELRKGKYYPGQSEEEKCAKLNAAEMKRTKRRKRNLKLNS